MSPTDHLIALYRPLIGSEIHCGPWLQIDQQRIDRFAEATGDHQWIHTDPQRARLESPYATTIAHGYLTLSLLPFLTESNAPGFFERTYPGMRLRINYGLDRLRFPAPVRAGARIRARTLLRQIERAGEGVQFGYLLTVEIEGEDKPACVAESLVRVYP
ncbi:MaoC family dehydratase [Geobacter sp. SVR]|uniref:MaoC family dehydratase n=1 Tax=Geobacter sp. SVR TaxID=2495594 RepID=UPI00143F0434|nr:MaoC family dehydratase [Geobacter sp. SVR]BCS52275.1 MaoC family dehydratase [Geobacter sp. SVR]GCF85064.1 MaoC family dehydratase [Geobacter sp. SVR]